MAQGSGPADRDSGGYFKQIRQAFTDRGIATFSFDKPGCGESTGDWRHYGLEGRANQMIAAIDVVRNHPGVSGDQLGIWGHSQGGWLVQKLAGQLDDLAFAITSSAPTINVGQQIAYDCERSFERDGLDQEQMRDALELIRALLAAATGGDDFVSISRELLAPASAESWYPSFPTIEDENDWVHFRQLISEPHDPLSDLNRITCPFLAVYGGLDPLLPPWQGAEESGRSLEAAGNVDATVMVFPHGDHRLQNPENQEFVPGYLDLLGTWTESRVS